MLLKDKKKFFIGNNIDILSKKLYRKIFKNNEIIIVICFFFKKKGINDMDNFFCWILG